METTDFGRGKICVHDHMKGYDKPRVIIVAGKRSSGKTTLINLIVQSLPVEQYISFDDQSYKISLAHITAIEEAWVNKELPGLRYIFISNQDTHVSLDDFPPTTFDISIFKIDSLYTKDGEWYPWIKTLNVDEKDIEG